MIAEERLFRDAPSRRDPGEEAKALVGREDVRAVVARDELEEVLVLEGVVQAGEVVLPRRHILGAVVVLPDIAARKDLIDLIRDEVPPERIDIRAVRRLALDAAQDADGVRPDGAAVLGDEVEQDARPPPVRLVELRRVESPLRGQEHGLAGRVARLVVPGVQRPGRSPLPLGAEDHVVRRVGAERQTAHRRHLEVPAQGALHVVSLVLVVSRRRRPRHHWVVAELDVGSRQPVRPVRGQVGLAAHQRAEDRARAAVGEVAVLKPSRHVEP